jgi:hypothetical protein
MEWDQPGSLLLRLDLFVGALDTLLVAILGLGLINDSRKFKPPKSTLTKFKFEGSALMSLKINFQFESSLIWPSQLTSIEGLSQISIEGLN